MAIFEMHRGSVTIDQSVAQRLGRLSNCNVVAQSFSNVISPDGYTFRLFCTHCKEQVGVDSLEKFIALEDTLRQFCLRHKHEVEAVDEEVLVGRKFREEQ